MAGTGEEAESGAGIGSSEAQGTGRQATSDWNRYGLTREARPSARGFQPDADIHGSLDSREDLYAEYRREATAARKSAPRRRARAQANLVGVSLLVVVAATFLVAGIVATDSIAKPTQLPSLSETTVVRTPAAVRLIPSSITLDLPAAVEIPDRATVPDDGTTLYLAGPDAGLAFNAGTGVVTTLQGPSFAPGFNRQLVAGGRLWRGAAVQVDVCDPTCWDQSTTFMVDPTTGHVDKAYAGTYLIGYDGGWIWIASRAGVQKLDPVDGAVQDSIPWDLDAEPRVGCGGLWARLGTGSGSSVTRIDVGTGKAVGKPADVAGQIIGPIQVDGGCWVTGVDVAGIGGLGMTQLATDGSISRVVSSEMKVVILDGEFWTCEPEGVMQRLHPGSGPYGPQIQLAVTSASGYPNTLFASLHTMWLIDYQGRLIGFDIGTGADNAGS